jgi:hypothetical protein
VGEMDIKNVITIKHIVNSFLAKNKYSIATAYILGLNTTVLSVINHIITFPSILIS